MNTQPEAHIAIHKNREGLRSHRTQTLHILNTLFNLHRLHHYQHPQSEKCVEEIVVEAPKKN